MYNWMKWLRLLGGWHFIAATAIKPPKAACQFAADDILLYKFAIISNGFTSPFGKKEKKNCHFYNTFYVFTYHIKTLQEESAKKSNIPWIWRIIYGHKLPYMKKTKITLYEEDKKEEASMRCSLLHGSWDQILRRRPSRMPCPLCIIYSYGWILFILGTNDHHHERVCRSSWPLTLTYIFKVIWPWLRKSCPLCSVYSSGWILPMLGTNDHYH